ncbi:MAG: hypothetical protein ACTHKU_03105 [Verrucomicrobiota bacterium]
MDIADFDVRITTTNVWRQPLQPATKTGNHRARQTGGTIGLGVLAFAAQRFDRFQAGGEVWMEVLQWFRM